MKFSFDIAPQSKERPRFTKLGSVFTPTKTRQFENYIKQSARLQMFGSQKTDKLLSAFIVFTFQKPKKTKLITPRKDLDNLCKAVFDALNDVVYLDDTQIVKIDAEKKFGANDNILLILEEL